MRGLVQARRASGRGGPQRCATCFVAACNVVERFETLLGGVRASPGDATSKIGSRNEVAQRPYARTTRMTVSRLVISRTVASRQPDHQRYISPGHSAALPHNTRHL